MNHTVEVSGNAVVATVSGALDGEAARGLSSALRERAFPGAIVILEMSGVTSVDVEGITQLVTLKRRAEREQGRLILAAPSYEVMDALRSNGLDRDFETAPSREAAVAAAGGAAPHGSAQPSPMHEEPGDFHAPPPLPVRAPEEPVRRREADEGEANEWVKPSAGGGHTERAAPPPVAAPPPSMPGAPGKKKKSALPLIILLLLVLGGGGAAGWWFFLRKKPMVLPQEGEWSRVEGADTEFEIKFRDAFVLSLKDSVLPEGLYLSDSTKDYADGLKSQMVTGTTREAGEHTFSVVARPAGDGDPSSPVTFKFKITAEEVKDVSGGKLRDDLMVKVPLLSGVQRLAAGCVKATAEGLDGTGLTVTTDVARRVAHLEGTPTKDGEIKFKVKAANADGQEKEFAYTVTVKAEPKPIDIPPIPDPTIPKTDPRTDPVPDPANPKPVPDPTPKPKPPPPPPPPPPPLLKLEPAMLTMLSERIEKSRFPESEKMQMRAAVNQVQGAERLAIVHFQHGERAISAGAKAALEQSLSMIPALAKKEHREKMDFVVIGYASRRGGTMAQNVAISKARAASVEAVLKSGALNIQPKFTGDYGATDVLGPGEDENRVVEIYAVIVKEETRETLKKLIDDMKRISGSR